MRKAHRPWIIAAPIAAAIGLAAILWLRPAGERTRPVIALTDVTAEAGIRFRHESGARGRMLNPETFGPGAGWFDHDGDRRPDLLLVNGNLLEGGSDPRATSVLYRNLGGGRFEDATERSGLGVPFYAMGFIAADIEGDGDQDLLLYGLHRSLLFLNDGAGRFRDATAGSGLEGMSGWVCAAAFLDYDRDGLLDLFIGNYVQWTPAAEEGKDCTFGTARKRYCPVALFDSSAPQLFRGRGDGTFQDRTEAAGLAGLRGKALGVAVEDYDRDGFPDIFVANDSVPNFLLRNRGDGTFEERGLESGFAGDPAGKALAGMGIDTAWNPDGGPLLIAIGNFSGEPTTLHLQEGRDFFLERSMQAGIGRQTLDRVTFGLILEDLDLDGYPDLFIASGHVFDIEELGGAPYRQTAQLFLGREGGIFEEARPRGSGDFLDRPILGRAAAAADFDGDGDLDLIVTENQGGAILLRNDLQVPRRFVRVDLRGTRSHREAIGAEVTLRLRGPAGGRTIRKTRKSASSYLSQSERQLTFGLRDGEHPLAAEVLWPSGLWETFQPVPEGRELSWEEGAGSPPSSGAGAAAAPEPQAAAPVIERRRGFELLEANRLEEAAAAFEEALGRDPHDLVARRGLLLALARLGRNEALEARVQETVRLFPDAHLLAGLAALLREEGGANLAMRFFDEALRLDPRRVDLWTASGNLAFDRRALDDAFERYHRALALNPEALEALTNTAKIHAIRKEYPLAVPLLEKAIALRPDLATALSTLGGILIETGDLDRAEELLQRALGAASSPGTLLTIHGNLGILYIRKRDYPRARACFENVLGIDPSDRGAREALSRLPR